MIYENALNPTAVLFREDQLFAPWVYVVLGAMAVRILFPDLSVREGFAGLTPSNDPGAYIVLTVIAMLTACLLRMSTEVTPTCVIVSFGWIPIYRMRIGIEEIRSVEPCTYRPLRDALGWGIRRTWKGETVLSARGSRAVRVIRPDGSVILIGSQQSEDLARTIEAARRSLMP